MTDPIALAFIVGGCYGVLISELHRRIGWSKRPDLAAPEGASDERVRESVERHERAGGRR